MQSKFCRVQVVHHAMQYTRIVSQLTNKFQRIETTIKCVTIFCYIIRNFTIDYVFDGHQQIWKNLKKKEKQKFFLIGFDMLKQDDSLLNDGGHKKRISSKYFFRSVNALFTLRNNIQRSLKLNCKICTLFYLRGFPALLVVLQHENNWYSVLDELYYYTTTSRHNLTEIAARPFSGWYVVVIAGRW